MNIVRRTQVADEPWSNGGGVTRTLLTWPPGGSWQLRVSVAQVERNGPFSALPGVVRHFAVLFGNGVELVWQDRIERVMRHGAPLSFDGAEPPQCRLLSGSTVNLNLMVRHDAGRGHLERFVPGHAWRPEARWRGLYTHESALLEADGSEWPLQPQTLAWTDQPDAGAWLLRPVTRGDAFCLWLDPTQP